MSEPGEAPKAPTVKGSSAGLVAHFAEAYPWRTVAMVALLILAGLVEGIGLATLLPVLEVVGGAGAPGDSRLSRMAVGALGSVGLAPTLPTLLALVVLALTFKAILRWLAMREVGNTIARVAGDLRLRLVRAIMAARWGHLANEQTGHFANALSAEAFRSAGAYRSACAALAVLIQILAYLAVAVLVSWGLALLGALAGISITFVLGGFVRASRRSGRDYTLLLKSLSGRLADVVPGIKAVKAMGRERSFLGWMERESGRLQRAERRLLLAHESLQSFHEPVLAAAVALGLYGAATWGGYPLSVLLLMAFLFYRVVGRFHVLQSEFQSLAAAESAFWSLDAQVRRAEAEREPAGGTLAPPPLEDGIVFDGVAFDHGERRVLGDVSFRIPAGRFVAFVGPSGGGKTTLVDLLIGLRSPSAGKVLVDGVELERLEPGAWRRRIGYVPQETILLHDTVARNVLLGADGAPLEGLERALRSAGAWALVERLEDGVESVVGERGLRLSGGERQRLAIARALVGAPTLLILDEPTAGLDRESEAAILETLRSLAGEMTIVAVSHHPAFAAAADLVYMVDRGRVEAALRPAPRL